MPTNREQVLAKMKLPKDASPSMSELSKFFKIPMSILQDVYNRGTGAYKSNPQSVRMLGSGKKGVNAPMSLKMSKEQWSMARVYSFVNKGKGTFYGADRDLAAKLK